MPIEKQMELFEDGGLKDEGGTVDPVSGNDVPPGSTQEEVRDDIPAQLSEGEFVFPADVVRFIGLEKLMQLRQSAKMGLRMMEEMGQMGNSEEAIIPDDVPFDINDLDIDDTPEYNQGGVVMQPGFTGIESIQPSQFENYQGQFAPYQPATVAPQAASQQFVSPAYIPPAQAVTPIMQQQQLPKFENFIATPTGAYDELREYRNSETGEVRQIPFVGGKPIYPIPEGFKYVDPEATKTEEVTTTPNIGQTRVETTTGGDRDEFDSSNVTSAAAKSLGYKTGTSSSKGLVSGLLGGIAGIATGLGAGLGIGAASRFGEDSESTYGKPGTIDPATGAIFGNANIPGLTKESPKVAQGFNPVTGQPMATFSGTPSASYMRDKISVAFGFAENPNATPTGYKINNPMAPTPLAQQGFKSTADIVRENTISFNAPSQRLVNPADREAPTPVSAESLGFSRATARHITASRNTGVFGSRTGDIVSTNSGLGVVNEAGQIETPQGTVVQRTDPTTGKKHSLLGTKEENEATNRMIDRNIEGYHSVEKSTGIAEDRPGSGEFGAPSRRSADPASDVGTSVGTIDVEGRFGGGGGGGGGGDSDGGGSDGGSSDGGSSDGGGRGTYICTASYSNGIISYDSFTSLKKYGILLRKNDPYLMKAYDWFGPIIAKYIKNKGVTFHISKWLTSYYGNIYHNKKLSIGQAIFDVASKKILRPCYRILGWTLIKIGK